MRPDKYLDNRVLFFASVPKKNDLTCVVVSISPAEKPDVSAKSNYHWQILKCRQLIFSVPEILASPVIGSQMLIYIIMSDAYRSKGDIQKQLQKLKLTFQEPVFLSNSVYEACLRYTLVARIAPLWNQAGIYLLQGRDFLLTEGPMNAIKLEIGMTDEKMLLILWPLRVKLPHMKLEDLEITMPIYQGFISHNIKTISEMSIGPQWIHVLPSLKKGRIVSISHQLPTNCPFRSYKELKRHWKNLYGYRLPEEEEHITFYSIYFPPLGPTLFTYPNLCICPMNLMLLRQVNHEDVLQNFLHDINRKMPNVCGQPFGLSCNLGYAIPKPLSLNQDLKVSDVSSSINADTSGLVPIRPLFLTPTCFNGEQTENSERKPPKNQEHFLSKDCLQNGNCLSTLIVETPSSECAPTPSNTSFTSKLELNNPSLADNAPDFQMHHSAEQDGIIKRSNQVKYVPVFKRKICLPYNKKIETKSHLVNQNVITCCSSQPQKPNVQMAENLNSNKENSYLSQLLLQNNYIRPSNTEINIQESRTPLKFIAHKIQKSPVTGELNLKRSAQTSSPSSVISGNKKPRSRPQVQTDVDVEALARNHDLVKVNTATLVNWLREKMVPCKVKDKKSDLVRKVSEYLNIPL